MLFFSLITIIAGGEDNSDTKFSISISNDKIVEASAGIGSDALLVPKTQHRTTVNSNAPIYLSGASRTSSIDFCNYKECFTPHSSFKDQTLRLISIGKLTI